MTKIITCAELRTRRLEDLQALFQSLEAELMRTAPGSVERKGSVQSIIPIEGRGALRLTTALYYTLDPGPRHHPRPGRQGPQGPAGDERRHHL